jgi:hypothetical protein
MRPRTILIIVTILCVGLLLALVATFAGAFLLLYRSTDAALSPEIDRLFAVIDRGAAGEFYATQTTPEFRSSMSKEQFEEFARRIKTQFGLLRSKKLAHIDARMINGQKRASVVYSAVFDKSAGNIRAEYKRDGQRWRLDDLTVEPKSK